MRRFYKSVEVASGDGGFGVLLDGKPIRTPAGRRFGVPTRALAREIAGEWDGVTEKGEIRPERMPLTRLAMTGIDRAADQRAKVVADIAAYGGCDLLCYRATEPLELVARQSAGWDPLLDWARDELGARLAVAPGVMPVDQADTALAALRHHVEERSELELSALFQLVTGFGSLVLALAILRGRLTAEQGSDLAEIDAQWQVERWGEDAEAERRRRQLRQDMLAAGRFLDLLRPTA
ncbi:MAG: ATP12 family chaperone protein [Reyranellaceae bacterium]